MSITVFTPFPVVLALPHSQCNLLPEHSSTLVLKAAIQLKETWRTASYSPCWHCRVQLSCSMHKVNLPLEEIWLIKSESEGRHLSFQWENVLSLVVSLVRNENSNRYGNSKSAIMKKRYWKHFVLTYTVCWRVSKVCVICRPVELTAARGATSITVHQNILYWNEWLQINRAWKCEHSRYKKKKKCAPSSLCLFQFCGLTLYTLNCVCACLPSCVCLCEHFWHVDVCGQAEKPSCARVCCAPHGRYKVGCSSPGLTVCTYLFLTFIFPREVDWAHMPVSSNSVLHTVTQLHIL